MRGPKPSERFAPDIRRFAIFVVPGWDIVNGGNMSICSIAAETGRMLAGRGVSVAVCTAYAQPRMLRFTKFDNDVELFAFEDMLAWFPAGSEVLVHVPELLVGMSVADHLDAYRARPDLKWRFNILLQNVKHIPSRRDVEALQELGPTTATIAHKASSALAEQLGCPIHYLSWFISAEDFHRVGYAAKKKLMVISPDKHPAKVAIVRRMAEALPDHKLIEIRKMTYQQYKEVIRDAKFMFTFGEGLDGYFVESIFSGAIGMAIFEDRYFTPEFRDLPGVFRDGETAAADVANFLRSADNEASYTAIAQRQYDLLAKIFRRDAYQANLRTFYEKYVSEWLSPAQREPLAS